MREPGLTVSLVLLIDARQVCERKERRRHRRLLQQEREERESGDQGRGREETQDNKRFHIEIKAIFLFLSPSRDCVRATCRTAAAEEETSSSSSVPS